MSLDKAIKSGKEKRKEYYDSRSFAPQCRNNKGCPACVSNRLIQTTKSLMKSQVSEQEYAES